MIRGLLAMMIIVSISYAKGERYYIKLGSFKNLQGLEKSINKMPKSLRSHVSIVKFKSWYIPFAYYRKSKVGLRSKLKVYRRYFCDADIVQGRKMFAHQVIYKFGKKLNYLSIKKSKHSLSRKNKTSSIKRVVVKNVATSSNDSSYNIPVQNYSSQNIPSILEALPNSTILAHPKKSKESKDKSFTMQMLSGHHYYMAYKAPKGEKSLLIKVSFDADRVNYQPILGDMQMRQANYLVKNSKLYMYADSFSSDGAYSTLDEDKKEYFLVSSWMKKKKLSTLRYYYKLNDAKRYLGVATSTGLSEVLQEGNFDEYFIEENDY